MSLSPLKLFGDCERITTHLMEGLELAACKTIRSFDLQAARKAHTNCSCPYHGEAQCDCQMIFLLVYFPDEDAPSTIIVHGYDGVTSLNWNDALSKDKRETLLNLVQRFSAKQEQLR